MHSEKNHIKFFNVKDAAEYLGISLQTLYSWTHTKKITHYKTGKLLFFNPAELQTFILSKRVKTVEEIQAEADRYLNTRGGINE